MLRRIIAPVAVAVVILLALEGIVRLAYPEIGPLGTDSKLLRDNTYGTSRGIKPNATGASYGAMFAANEHGFWSYEKPIEPSNSSWLLIGDSVTMGIGVEPDKTFAGLLSARIDSINVLNASLIGYSVADYANVLRSLLSERQANDYNVNRVTLFWCLNDIYADLPAGDPNETVRRSFGPILRWVRRHYRTYQWLKTAVTDRPRAYYQYDRTYYDLDRPYVERSLELLVEMRDLSRARNIPFDVILLPYRHQLSGNHRELLEPQRLLVEQLTAQKFDVIDFSSAMLDERTRTLYRFGDGIHFSPEGHRVIADLLTKRYR